MRVIEADDVEPAFPRLPASGDVFGWIELISGRTIREVADADGIRDAMLGSQEQSTALGGRGFAGVSHHVDEHA